MFMGRWKKVDYICCIWCIYRDCRVVYPISFLFEVYLDIEIEIGIEFASSIGDHGAAILLIWVGC
jgi:hypothetical protein